MAKKPDHTKPAAKTSVVGQITSGKSDGLHRQVTAAQKDFDDKSGKETLTKPVSVPKSLHGTLVQERQQDLQSHDVPSAKSDTEISLENTAKAAIGSDYDDTKDLFNNITIVSDADGV